MRGANYLNFLLLLKQLLSKIHIPFKKIFAIYKKKQIRNLLGIFIILFRNPLALSKCNTIIALCLCSLSLQYS